MSQFIGNAQSQVRLEANNISLLGVPWRPEREIASADKPQSYATPFWPGRTGFFGDVVSDFGLLKAEYYEPEITKGMNSRFGYQGVTRDVNNSPLGLCTVKCFRAVDDTKTTPDVVSEADGSFVISTPYYEPHWLRMSKSGAPDLQCTTVSTAYPNT